MEATMKIRTTKINFSPKLHPQYGS